MSTPDKKYYSYCLQANLKSAINSLSKPNSDDSSKVKTLRKKMLARFVQKTERAQISTKDPFVSSIVKIYREYYRNALLNPKKVSKFNDELYRDLKSALSEFGIKSSSKKPENIEKVLSAEIKKRGYYSLFGAVTPFRSLLIWKKEHAKIYTISLPETKQKVKVVFMDDFVELSWMHYATFGRYYVGGWAKKDALYCVKQAYKVGSPEFMAHYLAHEAQHFADYKSFPELSQADLEYRAKLAELAVTKTAKKFINKLNSEAKNDPTLPHCFAAYRIISKINPNQSAAKLKKAAMETIAAHSSELRLS